MNPAEVSQLQAAYTYQKELLQEFQGQLFSIQAAKKHLTQYIQSLLPTRAEPVRFALYQINLKALLKIAEAFYVH